MSRWSAAGIHFVISLIILVVALALMRLFWYPDFFFAAIGAHGLLVILFAVDLALGPLITLLIFKSGKKGLKFDLGCIAACQLIAMLYGMHTVFIARPAFVVFDSDRFQVVQAVDVDLSGAQYPEFQSLPWTGPRWAGLKLRDDDEAFQETLKNVIFGSESFSEKARFLVPYEDVKSAVSASLKPLKRLRHKNKGPDANKRVDDFLTTHGVQEEQVGYLPLTARAEHMAVIIARTTGEVLDVMRINPW
jgi:hypothetical protein